MKILHIPQRNIGLKKSVGGVKSILLEQIKWENYIENIESKILIYDKIEENNPFFINKNSIREDILNYKPDLVIFDGFWAIQHYFIAKFLKRNKIKYYIKPHGAFNRIAQKNSKTKSIKKLLARVLLFNNYVKESDGLIFLNEMEKENSIYRNKNEIILPNGIEKINLKFNKMKKKSKINFIFLGRIDIFHKGIDILLETILKNKKYFIENSVEFKFYGKGLEHDMKIFKNYISVIPSIVKYHGVVYGENKYKILQSNDVFILTSRFEGMPMGILEALSIGIPCFISQETGMAEYIEAMNAGWVNKSKENIFCDLKNCIEQIKIDYESYSNNAVKCSKIFYWENILKIYKKVYSDIDE